MKDKVAKGKTRGGKTSTKKKNRVEAAISDLIESELNDHHKQFCILFCFDKRCFGNKSRSYIEAYDLKTKKELANAYSMGSRLYRNVKIQEYIKKLLESRFNDEAADAELSKLMNQDADLPTKRAAIADYNKLKNRLKESPPTLGSIVIQIAPEVATKNGL